MEISIQDSSDSHLSELLPLIRAYHEFEDLKMTDLEREQSVRHLLSDKSLGRVWRVFVDTDLVGYIAICVGFSIEFSGLDAFIDEFYILPKYRGKGIGTRTLELAKLEANTLGIKALHLEVARSNAKAINLYSRAKFKARDKYVIMSVRL